MGVAQSDARSAIFASIRENLAASKPFDETHRDAHRRIEPFANPDVVTSRKPVDLLKEFKESLELVGADCLVVQSENGAATRLREIAKELSAQRVAISDSELVNKLARSAGIEVIQNVSPEELFSSDIGITSAQWAIAETGTLVLESGAEQHRLVSLVPPVHVCVLKASSIRQTMAQILEAADTDANRTITFITGASRTSDIELTLAIGVHGPGVLHVIVIKDQ